MTKKVLIISYARAIGGGEIYLSCLLPKLKTSFNVTVLASSKLKKLLANGVIFKNFQLAPRSLEKLPRNYRLRKAYYQTYFRYRFRLRNYDLISLQDFDGALIEAIDKRPIILTILTRFLVPRKFDQSVLQRFEKIDKVVCVSHQTKQDLLDRGVPASKCEVVHTAVDPEKYEVNKTPGAYITWVGRVEKADKNPLLFLKVAKTAQDKKANLKFRVVGKGSYLPALKSHSKNLGLTNLEFYGFCPPNKMKQIYKESSVLCMTSTSEGLPFVALEAMASGVPVVATNVGGLPELINSSSVGLLVDSLEPEIIFNKIKALTTNPKKYKAIQIAARHRVERSFNLDKMVQKTAKIYAEVIEK